MFSGSIENRLKIRERFDIYCDAVSRACLDDYLKCWTTDGIRLGDGGECHGVDDLRAQWDGIWQTLEWMVFFYQIGSIEIDGDRARAHSYCQEFLQLQNGSSRRVIGIYDDQLRYVDGQWLFCQRTYRMLKSHLTSAR